MCYWDQRRCFFLGAVTCCWWKRCVSVLLLFLSMMRGMELRGWLEAIIFSRGIWDQFLIPSQNYGMCPGVAGSKFWCPLWVAYPISILLSLLKLWTLAFFCLQSDSWKRSQGIKVNIQHLLQSSCLTGRRGKVWTDVLNLVEIRLFLVGSWRYQPDFCLSQTKESLAPICSLGLILVFCSFMWGIIWVSLVLMGFAP